MLHHKGDRYYFMLCEAGEAMISGGSFLMNNGYIFYVQQHKKKRVQVSLKQYLMQTDKTVIFADGNKLNYQLSNLVLQNPNAKPRRERVRISTFTKIKVKSNI
jgi:hypothetical protein